MFSAGYHLMEVRYEKDLREKDLMVSLMKVSQRRIYVFSLSDF